MARKRATTKTVSAMLDNDTDTPIIRDAIAFLRDITATLRKKNRAYGDSLGNPLMLFSKSTTEERLRTRLDDKLSRIFRGDGSGNENDIGDLVGYLAMFAAVRRKARP
jgi:PhoPQ-activated pathogenicity-related protein